MAGADGGGEEGAIADLGGRRGGGTGFWVGGKGEIGTCAATLKATL